MRSGKMMPRGVFESHQAAAEENFDSAFIDKFQKLGAQEVTQIRLCLFLRALRFLEAISDGLQRGH